MKNENTVMEILAYDLCSNAGLMLKCGPLQVSIVRTAVAYFHDHLEHLLTRVNRVFPKNSPEGGLQEAIRLLSWLVIVDEDDTFGERKEITGVGEYLKRYAKVSRIYPFRTVRSLLLNSLVFSYFLV